MPNAQRFRFLVLNPEPKTLEALQQSSFLAQYTFEALEDPYALLGRLRQGAFFGLLMPVSIGNISNVDFLRLLRGDTVFSSLLVGLVYTEQDQNALLSKTLDLGPSFCIKAPLNPAELALQLKYLETPPSLTKVEDSPPASLRLGELEMDLERYEFRLKNKPIQLTPIEFKLLKLFIERKGRIQTREHLLATVWGYNAEVESRTIDTHIRRLREKLQEEAQRLHTVRGVGYKLLEDN